MTRYSFGGDVTHLLTTADQNIGGALKAAPGASITFYSVRSGGSPVTDYMLDENGTGTYSVPVTEIVARETGYLPNFQGPDGVEVLYYDPDPDDEDVQRVRLVAWDSQHALIPTGDETTEGLVRKATQAEVDEGVSDVGFVTPLKMAATTLFLKAKGAVVSITGTNETAAKYTVNDDGSLQSGWVNRLTFSFGNVLTGHFNRYGELRANAAKAANAAFVVRNLNPNPTGNLIEAEVTEGSPLFYVRANGHVVAPNIAQKVIVLNAEDPVPSGTPDLTLIARLTPTSTTQPVTDGGSTPPPTSGVLLKDHPHEGAVGSTPTASGEGYTSSGGTLPTYVAATMVGSSALQWPTGVTGNLVDTFTAQDADLYVRFYFRQDAEGTGVTVPLWMSTIGAELRFRVDELAVYDQTAGTTNAAVPINPKPVNGTWYRGLWRVGVNDSTLSIWVTNPASTGAADFTTTTTWVSPKARPTNFLLGNRLASGGQHTIDAVALATYAIGPVE